MSSGMDDVARGWLQHRMVIDDLLALVKDEDINYKPWEGAMSLGELAIHIVTSTDMFIKGIKKGEFVAPEVENDYETMDELRAIIKRYTDHTKEEITSIFDFQLKGYMQFGKIRAPGTYWLSNAIDHEIHHKGQLFTYVRMTGAKDLPFFMRQPNEI